MTVFASNPLTYLVTDAFSRSIKSLAEDGDQSLRLSFITAFPVCYMKAVSAELKDRLFSWLMSYYSSSDAVICECLVQTREIYQVIGPGRVAAVLPALLRLLAGLTKWRVARAAVEILTTLPREPLLQLLPQIWQTVIRFLNAWSAPLKVTVFAFFAAVYRSSDQFSGMIVRDLRQSNSHVIRAIFPEVVVGCCLEIPLKVFMEVLWPNFLSLIDDEVPSVKVSLLRAMPLLRRFFMANKRVEAEAVLVRVFRKLERDPDPFVHEIARESSEPFFCVQYDDPTPLAQIGNFSKTLVCSAGLAPIVKPLADAKRRRTSAISLTSFTPKLVHPPPMRVGHPQAGGTAANVSKLPLIHPKPNQIGP
jgi:hypothetical protein